MPTSNPSFMFSPLVVTALMVPPSRDLNRFCRGFHPKRRDRPRSDPAACPNRCDEATSRTVGSRGLRATARAAAAAASRGRRVWAAATASPSWAYQSPVKRSTALCVGHASSRSVRAGLAIAPATTSAWSESGSSDLARSRLANAPAGSRRQVARASFNRRAASHGNSRLTAASARVSCAGHRDQPVRPCPGSFLRPRQPDCEPEEGDPGGASRWELPEPVDRRVEDEHEPPWKREPGDLAAPARRLQRDTQRDRRKGKEQESADDARLLEHADREAVRIEGLLAGAAILHIWDGEVVGADADDRMLAELDEADRPEVVSVASQPVEVRRGADGLAAVTEVIPRRPGRRDRRPRRSRDEDRHERGRTEDAPCRSPRKRTEHDPTIDQCDDSPCGEREHRRDRDGGDRRAQVRTQLIGVVRRVDVEHGSDRRRDCRSRHEDADQSDAARASRATLRKRPPALCRSSHGSATEARYPPAERPPRATSHAERPEASAASPARRAARPQSSSAPLPRSDSRPALTAASR